MEISIWYIGSSDADFWMSASLKAIQSLLRASSTAAIVMASMSPTKSSSVESGADQRVGYLDRKTAVFFCVCHGSDLYRL